MRKKLSWAGEKMTYVNTAQHILETLLSDKLDEEKIQIIKQYENSEEEFGLMHVPHSYLARAALIILGHDEYERNRDIDYFIREFKWSLSKQ